MGSSSTAAAATPSRSQCDQAAPSPAVPQQPYLSSTQKAYRTDPDGFVARLRARAQSLFEDGYTVRPGNKPHLVSGGAPKPPGRHREPVRSGRLRGALQLPVFLGGRSAANASRKAKAPLPLPASTCWVFHALVRQTWRRHASEGGRGGAHPSLAALDGVRCRKATAPAGGRVGDDAARRSTSTATQSRTRDRVAKGEEQ
jgi:hypothetical protein